MYLKYSKGVEISDSIDTKGVILYITFTEDNE